MNKLRFYLALWLAKLSVPALKITRHNGTDFPGALALRICPDFLSYIGYPATVVAVTGTNGKTTASNLLCDLLERNGKTVLSNRFGSNIASGIATVLLRGATLGGRAKKRYDLAVLEIDERSSPRVFPFIKPSYVVITNLFRDSIMRNAHPDYIASILTSSIPTDATLIVNADDLISYRVSPNNPRVSFAIDRLPGEDGQTTSRIDDLRICPLCHAPLIYDYRHYHHLGRAHCSVCTFASPTPTFLASDPNFEGKTMTVSEGEERFSYSLISDNLFNAYNTLTAISTMRMLGHTHDKIAAALKDCAVAASRHNEEMVGGVNLIMQMSKEKNALAASRAFDYIGKRSGEKEILMMMNCLGDTTHWSENCCWIYDTDFEYLKDDSVKAIVCAGARADDYRLRLLLAGVKEDRILVVKDEFAAVDALPLKKGHDVYLLYGTDSLARAYRVYDYMKKRAADKAETEGGIAK